MAGVVSQTGAAAATPGEFATAAQTVAVQPQLPFAQSTDATPTPVVMSATWGLHTPGLMTGGYGQDLKDLAYKAQRVSSSVISTNLVAGALIQRIRVDPWDVNFTGENINKWAETHTMFCGSFNLTFHAQAAPQIYGSIMVAYLPFAANDPPDNALSIQFLKKFPHIVLDLKTGGVSTIEVRPTTDRLNYIQRSSDLPYMGELVVMTNAQIGNIFNQDVQIPWLMDCRLADDALYLGPVHITANQPFPSIGPFPSLRDFDGVLFLDGRRPDKYVTYEEDIEDTERKVGRTWELFESPEGEEFFVNGPGPFARYNTAVSDTSVKIHPMIGHLGEDQDDRGRTELKPNPSGYPTVGAPPKAEILWAGSYQTGALNPTFTLNPDSNQNPQSLFTGDGFDTPRALVDLNDGITTTTVSIGMLQAPLTSEYMAEWLGTIDNAEGQWAVTGTLPSTYTSVWGDPVIDSSSTAVASQLELPICTQTSVATALTSAGYSRVNMTDNGFIPSLTSDAVIAQGQSTPPYSLLTKYWASARRAMGKNGSAVVTVSSSGGEYYFQLLINRYGVWIRPNTSLNPYVTLPAFDYSGIRENIDFNSLDWPVIRPIGSVLTWVNRVEGATLSVKRAHGKLRVMTSKRMRDAITGSPLRDLQSPLRVLSVFTRGLKATETIGAAIAGAVGAVGGSLIGGAFNLAGGLGSSAISGNHMVEASEAQAAASVDVANIQHASHLEGIAAQGAQQRQTIAFNRGLTHLVNDRAMRGHTSTAESGMVTYH